MNKLHLNNSEIMRLFCELVEYTATIAIRLNVSHEQVFSIVLGVYPDLFNVLRETQDYDEVCFYLENYLESLRKGEVRLQ